jgi:hypothetical protein
MDDHMNISKAKVFLHLKNLKFQNTSPTNLHSATLWRRVILSIDKNVSEQRFASFFRVEVCRIYL